MGDQYEQIPAALIGTQPSGAYTDLPPSGTAPPSAPPFAKVIPSSPSERIGCCDAKTMVLVSASLLLVSELATAGWYVMWEQYIYVLFSIANAVLCLLCYMNMFGFRSAPVYIITGTLMLITTLAKAGYSTFVLLPDYSGSSNGGEHLRQRCPPFETYLMAVVAMVGLVQMYRVQNFSDTYGALAAVASTGNAKSGAPSDIETAKTVAPAKKKGKKKTKKTTTTEA